MKPSSRHAAERQLVEEIEARSEAFENLQVLADDIGTRQPGTANEVRARDFLTHARHTVKWPRRGRRGLCAELPYQADEGTVRPQDGRGPPGHWRRPVHWIAWRARITTTIPSPPLEPTAVSHHIGRRCRPVLVSHPRTRQPIVDQ